jgi:RNA polymerase sigma factor (sigma-70 family)
MIAEQTVPDSSLIEAIKKGNDRVLGIFYKENYGKVQNMIFKNSGSDDDAKDVYQESMIELVQQIRIGRLDRLASKLSTYLYAICHHKWIDKLRKSSKVTTTPLDDQAADVVIENDGPSPYLLAMEMVLTELGERCKDLLHAFYYERLPMAEIAARLGFQDDNSAKSQKNKCMDKARLLAKNTIRQYQS